jgi:deoxyribonucleoside regulator
MKKRVSREERRRLLLEVARLHYEQRLSKTDISHKVETSPTQVARLLQEAEELGIVKFQFAPPKSEELALELEGRYPFLKKAVVVPRVKDPLFQQHVLAVAAAEYFEAHVRPHTSVGLSGGNTIYQMVKELPERRRAIKIFPTAIIGRGPTITHIDPMVLVAILWAKSGGEPGAAYSVTVPPINSGLTLDHVAKEYRKFKSWPQVQEVYEGMQKVDTVFASLGSIRADEDYRRSTRHDTAKLLGTSEISESELEKEGIVGDINYSFFDVEGQTKPRWNPFLSLDVNMLQEMVADGRSERRVVVVVGQYKVNALRAALTGNLCNVVVTDDAAAQELLK